MFTSSNSRHTREIVAASREGGAPLTILSGLVAGNFSVFWKSLTIATLLFVAYRMSLQGLAGFMGYPAVFAFGLVAFGLLGMGPVTIAVDSYGPVTDNAQSIFELSQIESIPGGAAQIEKEFNQRHIPCRGSIVQQGSPATVVLMNKRRVRTDLSHGEQRRDARHELQTIRLRTAGLGCHVQNEQSRRGWIQADRDRRGRGRNLLGRRGRDRHRHKPSHSQNQRCFEHHPTS